MYQVGARVEPRSQYNLITRNYIDDGIIVMDDGAGNSWGGNGLMIHSSNNEVSYNRFVNCVAASSQAGNLVVRNNIFYNSGATMGLTQNPGVPFTHDSANNHDPDTGENGTTITVARP